MTEECYTASRVTMEDIPSEEKSIGIADAFIRDYQINL